jgi:hypothetical protein
MIDAQELAVVAGLVEAVAARHYGGNVTLVRGPSGWQVAYGRPANLPALENHPTLVEGLRELIVEPVEL